MKTLIDVRLLGRGAHSGIPVFAKETTDHLLSQGKDAFELLYAGIKKSPLPVSWRTNPRVTIRDWRIANKALDLASTLFNAPDISRHTKADIIFSPHFHNLNKGSLPRVLTIHDLSFAHYPTFFSPKQRLWHSMQHWQKQIQEADHLIAVSRFTKEDIIQTLGIKPEKISVVYPGISREFHPLDPHDKHLLLFQKKHEIHTPYFLYFGALEARKNVVHVIQAFDLLKTNPKYKDYRLILAGSPGHRAHEIARAASQSRSAAAISIISRITDEERILLYNGAVAFVCTSFFEGFGFPVLEAQACGIPVIASNRTTFIETLAGSAPLVNPWRPAELADALINLATDGAVRARAINLGTQNASRFNWSDTAKHVHAILIKTHRSFYG